MPAQQIQQLKALPAYAKADTANLSLSLDLDKGIYTNADEAISGRVLVECPAVIKPHVKVSLERLLDVCGLLLLS